MGTCSYDEKKIKSNLIKIADLDYYNYTQIMDGQLFQADNFEQKMNPSPMQNFEHTVNRIKILQFTRQNRLISGRINFIQD